MKLLVIADTDDVIRSLPETKVEVLISCGDLLDSTILQAATHCHCQHILAVKGNHDSAAPFPSPVQDLHLRTCTIQGVTFGGLQGAWRYKPRGHFLYEQEEAAQLIKAMPAVDIFVAHNSPRHIHDIEDEVHLGFDCFLNYLDHQKPRWFLHGHQHVNQVTTFGSTQVIGIYGWRMIVI